MKFTQFRKQSEKFVKEKDRGEKKNHFGAIKNTGIISGQENFEP